MSREALVFYESHLDLRPSDMIFSMARKLKARGVTHIGLEIPHNEEPICCAEDQYKAIIKHIQLLQNSWNTNKSNKAAAVDCLKKTVCKTMDANFVLNDQNIPILLDRAMEHAKAEFGSKQYIKKVHKILNCKAFSMDVDQSHSRLMDKATCQKRDKFMLDQILTHTGGSENTSVIILVGASHHYIGDGLREANYNVTEVYLMRKSDMLTSSSYEKLALHDLEKKIKSGTCITIDEGSGWDKKIKVALEKSILDYMDGCGHTEPQDLENEVEIASDFNNGYDDFSGGIQELFDDSCVIC